MLRFILLLALQGISGGISGYITNKYAVNMLFKEYTPLKLGGVIKKKKEKFIEEISELVERDIINSETLKAEISNKNLKPFIDQISEFFFEKGLNESLGCTKLCDVHDFSNSIIKSEEFIRNNLNEILPEFLDNIFTKVNLEDILTKEQISQIINASYDLFLDELEKTNELSKFISDFHEENSNISLNNILSEEVIKKLVDNVTQYTTEIINENILKDEESCKIFLDNILQTIDISSVLSKLEKQLSESEINNYISDFEKEEITLNLFNKINRFINSEKGEELILSFINELYTIGRDVDFTIYELLPNEMEQRLTSFIKIVIPKLMPYISDWMTNNKASFDEMIEEAIDEAIEGMDENIKKLVVSKVRSALMGDISSKNDIVSKIISYFNDSLDDESYSKIANSIIDYLKDKKVKDIINILEKEEILNSKKLVKFIIKQFEEHGKNIIDKLLQDQFSKKINDFAKLDLIKLFNDKLKPALYNGIFKNKDKFSGKITHTISGFIFENSNKLFSKNLSELVSKDKLINFSDNTKALIVTQLKDMKISNKDKLEKLVNTKISEVNLSTLENYKVDISELIVDKAVVIYEEFVDKNKNREVKELVKEYFTKEQLSDILTNQGYPELISRLPNLLDGNIKKFAKNNLSKYNEDEICDMVQDFMGNQLKPLSVFGAILGTAVGVIYQLIFPDSIGSYGFPGSALNTVLSCAIMAGIGYITNVIALWMIFHPYKENKIVSKIPFFKKFALGYIPANKDQFAIGMAKLIDEELLNKEEINKSFNLHKDNIKVSLTALVMSNNYQLITGFIRNKKQAASKYFYSKLLKYCGNNNELSGKLSNGIGEVKLSTVLKKEQVLNFSPKLISGISKFKDYLAQLAYNKISVSGGISGIISEKVISDIRKNIQFEVEKSLQENVTKLRNFDLITVINENYGKDYKLQISKSFKDIFDSESLSKAQNNLGMKIYSYATNDFKEYISNYIKDFLHSGLDADNDIGSVFEGRVKKVINNNLQVLTTYFTGKVLLYLKDNQDELAITVQNTIKENLNFFEQIAYGSFGGDEIAYRVVEIILNKKLPIMLEAKREKLLEVTKLTLDESIYPMKINVLKIKADEINSVMLIENIFDKFNKSVKLRDCITRSSSLIIEALTSVPIAEYLELCNLHSLDLVCKKLHNEIGIIKEDIYSNININNSNLSKIIGQFTDEKLVLPLFNSEIFAEITSEDLKDTANNILTLLSDSKETKRHIEMFLEAFHRSTLAELSINNLVDTNILAVDISEVISRIFEDEEFNDNNMKLLEKVIENASNNNLDFISDNTKDYLIDKTMQTGLTSINEYIVPVMQEVNLKNISNKQIELLNPREIDILFNSFAGDFFNKLRIYGVFGFVFGINVWLSMILLALDVKYSKRN